MKYFLLFIFLLGIQLPLFLEAQRTPQEKRLQRLKSQITYDQYTGKNMRFFMSSRWMEGVDVQFSDLGQVSRQVLDDSGRNSVFQFDDGFVALDADQGPVTSAFGFDYDNATTNADGYVDSFTLTRYSSESAGQSAEVDRDNNLGVEMGLQYFVVNQRNFRFGLVGSMGINDLNADSTEEVEGQLYREMATVLLENSQIVPISGQRYLNNTDRGPVLNLENGFLFDPSQRERVTQDIAGEGEVGVPSDVRGVYNLDGVTSGLRLGVISEFNLGRFWIQAGGGYTAVYTYSDFSSSQRIVNPNIENSVQVTQDIQSSEWFFGPYGEIRAGFRINPNSRIYLGAMYINMNETFSQSAGGVGSNIGLENPILFEIGVNVDF